MRRIAIFDTTLRDGEQAPGFSLNAVEKLEMARQLARLSVDVMEAGFPASSREDFEGVRTIAGEVGGTRDDLVICGLARCVSEDIQRCAEAVRPARRSRIHVFIATSEIHLRRKLGMSESEVLRAATDAVREARTLADDVEFSPEDAMRTAPGFLDAVCAAVAEAGANIINVPDTVGYATPSEMAETIARLRRVVPDVPLSVHCHDDLGLAVANSMAALQAGASQIECTINGIGERAGNAALEEVVMGLAARRDHYGLTCDVETRELAASSRRLAHLTGIPAPPNKAIVGSNAFAHEAGIHQDGVLKSRATYEIMSPADVGIGSSAIVLGKHSGRRAFTTRLQALGYRFEPDQVDPLFARFKSLAARKKTIYDDDLVALVTEEAATLPAEDWSLGSLQVTSGTHVIPTATVAVRRQDEERRASGVGDGPVDAVFQALRRATGNEDARVVFFSTAAASPGADAIGEVSLRLCVEGREVTGRGRSTDTVEAAARAFLDALGRHRAATESPTATEGAASWA